MKSLKMVINLTVTLQTKLKKISDISLYSFIFYNWINALKTMSLFMFAKSWEY